MAFPDKNHVLGSGELYFSPFAPDTRTPTGQEYFGNTTEINLNVESEMLDHFDTDHGIRQKDDSVLLEKNMSGSFITDQISPKNLAKWFTGTALVIAQSAAVSVTETFTNVKRGVRYQIGATTINPPGVRGLSSASAVMEGAPDVALVANTDIVYDLATGSFLIKSTSAVVTADDTEDVTVTYSAPSLSYNRVTSGSEANLEGELFYKSINGKGEQMDYYFPYVQLAPDGDMALKGDDWQQLGFTFQALKRDNDTEIVYTNGRAGVGI